MHGGRAATACQRIHAMLDRLGRRHRGCSMASMNARGDEAAGIDELISVGLPPIANRRTAVLTTTNSRTITRYLQVTFAGWRALPPAVALALTFLPTSAFAQTVTRTENQETQETQTFFNNCTEPTDEISAQGVRRTEQQFGPNQGDFRERTEFNGRGLGVPSTNLWDVRDFNENQAKSSAKTFTTEQERRERIVRVGASRTNPRRDDNSFIRFRDKTVFNADGTVKRSQSDFRAECK